MTQSFVWRKTVSLRLLLVDEVRATSFGGTADNAAAIALRNPP